MSKGAAAIRGALRFYLSHPLQMLGASFLSDTWSGVIPTGVTHDAHTSTRG